MNTPIETGKVEQHTYVGTPFSIKCYELSYGKGYWTTWRVHVFKDGKDIGNYERKYHGYVKDTLYPFELDGIWYALYSADYTTTRVARLEDKFEDWCGETGKPDGFCPVEFYVPRYNKFRSSYKYLDESETSYTFEVFDNEATEEQFIKDMADQNWVKTAYTNFGFMCGCVWGDDTSWKLRFIDLSKIHDKQFTITEKFGYWELPDQPLRTCVKIPDLEGGYLRITGAKHFDLD